MGSFYQGSENCPKCKESAFYRYENHELHEEWDCHNCGYRVHIFHDHQGESRELTHAELENVGAEFNKTAAYLGDLMADRLSLERDSVEVRWCPDDLYRKAEYWLRIPEAIEKGSGNGPAP